MDVLADINIWALIGFSFAAYAVVGNDALQTLGTFINSNRRLPWWVLYLFAVTILVVTFFWGWSLSHLACQYETWQSGGRKRSCKVMP